MIDHLATVFNVPPANVVIGVGSLTVLALTLVGTTTTLILGKIGRSKRRRRANQGKPSHSM
jgi:hypothetical protein